MRLRKQFQRAAGSGPGFGEATLDQQCTAEVVVGLGQRGIAGHSLLEVANRLRNYHLARVDKLTMGVGLEPRCPFLDVNVVELGLRLPASLKRPDGRPKGLLADAFAADLPDWLVARRKQPFTVPVAQIL